MDKQTTHIQFVFTYSCCTHFSRSLALTLTSLMPVWASLPAFTTIAPNGYVAEGHLLSSPSPADEVVTDSKCVRHTIPASLRRSLVGVRAVPDHVSTSQGASGARYGISKPR